MLTPIIAASMHIGTIRMTASGSSQLSYSAASSRKTNTTASPNAIDRGVAGELLLQRDLGPFEAEARAAALLSATFSMAAMRLAGGEAAQQRHLHLGRGIQVVARHAVRARWCRGRSRPSRSAPCRRCRCASCRFSTSRSVSRIRIVGLRRHLIGAAEDVEVVDVGRAHVDRQRVEHAADRHAEQLGLGAVDLGLDLRRVCVEQREGLGEARASALAAPATPRSPLSSAGSPRPARSWT